MDTLARYIDGRLYAKFETLKEVRYPRKVIPGPQVNLTTSADANETIYHFFTADPIMHRIG
jgi:hypothetical protein